MAIEQVLDAPGDRVGCGIGAAGSPTGSGGSDVSLQYGIVYTVRDGKVRRTAVYGFLSGFAKVPGRMGHPESRETAEEMQIYPALGVVAPESDRRPDMSLRATAEWRRTTGSPRS